MCANYRPTRPERFAALGVSDEGLDYAAEVWPGGRAPFVLNAEGGRRLDLGVFGLIPHWAKAPGESLRRCYNARTETVATKPSFRDAWRQGQRCVVPADAFFEPNYETGKAVRWSVERADGEPLLIGGLWSEWVDRSSGEVVISFSLLTVNVAGHPLLNRLHAPEDEKRGLVMLERVEVDQWLNAPVADVAGLLRPYPPEAMLMRPAPIERRRRSPTV